MTPVSRARSGAVATLAATALVLSAPALAHPEHDREGTGVERFPGEGVAGDKQHDGDDGHLPASRDGVELVGKAEVTNPSGDGNTGRVADVFAHGDFAYLTAFAEPTCAAGGVHVMDISDLTHPSEVTDAFIPTSPGSYAGEGIQVIEINNDTFDGDVLIHQNETCDDTLAPSGRAGGISLWDVSDPTDPRPLARHVGDDDGGGLSNTVHSMFAWQNRLDKHTYVVLVDNEELTDVDILDITDPANPVMVNDALDLVDLFAVDQPTPGNLQSVFSHDMVVYEVGKRYVMTMSYWDGGYVLLDVTDPTPGNVTLIAESDYAELDEQRLARGQRISPEGNAHQSELSPDRRFLIGTDEDFSPFRVAATIDSGPHAGTAYFATSASDTPPVDEQTRLAGPTTFVGEACQRVRRGSGIALVERGTCAFQDKLDSIAAAGYSSGIVFNDSVGCDGLVTMLAAGDIPFVFTTRTAGLQLLGNRNLACGATTPAAGSPSAGTAIEAVFDGWGYVRLFRTDIPRAGGPGSISQTDTYAIEESQRPSFADGFGDLSVHEVAMDPDERLAYLSYYAGGLRVVSYGPAGLDEVGHFIDVGGNNFWGVEVYQRNGDTYVLASDRDFGLYILRAVP